MTNRFATITWPLTFILGGILRWAIDTHLARRDINQRPFRP
jgi:hypothetical protein